MGLVLGIKRTWCFRCWFVDGAVNDRLNTFLQCRHKVMTSVKMYTILSGSGHR